MIIEFCQRVSSDGSFHFLRQKDHEIQLQQSLRSQLESDSKSQISDFKQQLSELKESSEDQFKKIQAEKAEYSASDEILRD